jgi:hypothetical protein
MSGVVLDVPVIPAQPSFFRLLWSVLLGYILAFFTLGVLYLPLYELGFVPRPFARPGPFPVEGAWSLDADLVATAVIVLVASWWIRKLVAEDVRAPVSFGVVVVVVAVTGYAPFLALRPAALSGVIALPATTWLARRYAIGTTLPFPRPSWRAWLALALVGVAVYGSYQLYHPLVADGGGGAGGGSAGSVDLWNPGWADLTILRVDGGFVGSDPFERHSTLPYTVRPRSNFSVWAYGRRCPSNPIVITFSVLGRTSTQSFIVPANLCGD